MKKKINQILIIFMMVCAMMLLTSCGSKKNDKEHLVVLQDVFKLSPEDSLDLSKEDIESSQEIILVIYDVASNGDANEELSSFNDSIKINFNDTNEYSQLDGYELKTYENFVENSGYVISTDNQTIWGGSEPVRMIAAFKINKNDLKKDLSATITFELSEEIKDEWNITNEDMKTISLYDGVFAVEENPELYQVSRSIVARTSMVYQSIQSAATAWKNGDKDNLNLASAMMQTLFSEQTEWGVSCGLDYSGVIISSENLSSYNPEALKLLDDDVAKEVESLIKNINELVPMLANPEGHSGQQVGTKMNEMITQTTNIKNAFNED